MSFAIHRTVLGTSRLKQRGAVSRKLPESRVSSRLHDSVPGWLSPAFRSSVSQSGPDRLHQRFCRAILIKGFSSVACWFASCCAKKGLSFLQRADQVFIVPPSPLSEYCFPHFVFHFAGGQEALFHEAVRHWFSFNPAGINLRNNLSNIAIILFLIKIFFQL
jgi:hypothetical protein